MERIYDIPLSENAAMIRRFVTVSADGNVYFLRTRNGEVDVIGVGARRWSVLRSAAALTVADFV
jgi:hypothetical protein